MGRSSKPFLTISAALTLCCSGTGAGAAEIIHLGPDGATTRVETAAAGQHEASARRPARRDIAAAPPALPVTNVEFAGVPFGPFLDGPLDPPALLPPPLPPAPPPAPFPQRPFFPAPAMVSPPAPPPCPLIIEVGRGLRHRIGSRVISGHRTCR